MFIHLEKILIVQPSFPSISTKKKQKSKPLNLLSTQSLEILSPSHLLLTLLEHLNKMILLLLKCRLTMDEKLIYICLKKFRIFSFFFNFKSEETIGGQLIDNDLFVSVKKFSESIPREERLDTQYSIIDKSNPSRMSILFGHKFLTLKLYQLSPPEVFLSNITLTCLDIFHHKSIIIFSGKIVKDAKKLN